MSIQCHVHTNSTLHLVVTANKGLQTVTRWQQGSIMKALKWKQQSLPCEHIFMSPRHVTTYTYTYWCLGFLKMITKVCWRQCPTHHVVLQVSADASTIYRPCQQRHRQEFGQQTTVTLTVQVCRELIQHLQTPVPDDICTFHTYSGPTTQPKKYSVFRHDIALWYQPLMNILLVNQVQIILVPATMKANKKIIIEIQLFLQTRVCQHHSHTFRKSTFPWQ